MVDVFSALQAYLYFYKLLKMKENAQASPISYSEGKGIWNKILSKCWMRGFWHHHGGDQHYNTYWENLEDLTGSGHELPSVQISFLPSWAGWIRELQTSFPPQIQQ